MKNRNIGNKQIVISSIVILAGVFLGLTVAYRIYTGNLNRAQTKVHTIIPDYLRTHTVRKLQIGAGVAGNTPAFSDWLNTDIEPVAGEAYLDAAKPFPLPDGVLSYVFSEHLIEHLSYRDGLMMLRECYRTLKPGGKVRIATPDLLKLVGLFQTPRTDAMRNYVDGKLKAPYWPERLPLTVSPECVILNYELKSFGHQFVYDPRTLRDSLERAGFQDVKQFVSGESDDLQLKGLEVRHTWVEHAVSDYETMVFQAVRPKA